MNPLDKIKSVALHFRKLDVLHRIICVLLVVTVVFCGVIFARHYYLKRAASLGNRTQDSALSQIEIERIEIRNQTKAIEVISKKIDKDFLQIEIRNVGERPIISYQVDLRGNDKFVMDLSVGSPIATGRKTYIGVPLKKLVLDEQSQKYLLTISMALFADGTGEGDQAKFESQRDQMIGMAAAMVIMHPLVSKLTSESELTSEQVAQQLDSLKMKMPANFNRDQTVGYMNAIRSMQTRALVMNKLPAQAKSGGMQNFKNAFARQLTNLRAIKKEAK